MTCPENHPDCDNKNSNSLSLKDEREHAWKWFHYHAGQRMVAFNFFLVLMGALSVGYIQAWVYGLCIHAGSIAIVGVLVSLLFILLDIRNEQLVDVGRAALKSIEEHSAYESLPNELMLIEKSDTKCCIISHNVCLRFIQIILCICFSAAAYFSFFAH